MMINIIFAVAFLVGFLYLGLFFRFAVRFSRRYPDVWRQLDCPESFGLRGQATYLGVIFGLERRVSREKLADVHREVQLIRVTFLVALVAMILVVFMAA